MRIGIDATAVHHERTGVEGHVFAVVEALAAHTDHELVVFVRTAPPSRWAALGDRLDLRVCPRSGQAMATQVWLPGAVRRADLDVLHCPAKPPPAVVGVPVLDTIHDMVPWNRPETMGRGAGLWFRTFERIAVHRGAHVATVSEAAAAEIRDRLRVADRLHVVGQAIPPWLEAAAATPAARPAIAGVGRYVLSVCRLEPRKDLGTVLDAWDRLRPRHPDVRLLLAGAVGWRVDAVIERARRTPGVELLGRVDEDALPGLYAHADVFVTASLEEGFGLPVLEAMVFGAPVVASAIPPHVEVAGGAARLFPPGDAGVLADALATVLDDRDAAVFLRTAGQTRAAAFTASALADRLERALERTVAA